MYSGITLRKSSGNLIGAHQKIDRAARRNIAKQLPKDLVFPAIRDILFFEGKNGPDGIKRKSPARDEPWHYIDPSNHEDRQLLDLIDNHIVNLSRALASGNYQRSAFEAAWLAHAIVDGLTPAHHFPLEAKLEELRGGESLLTRDSFRKKIVMPGDTRRERAMNNWEYWGAKGVMTTHVMFEIGVATTIASHRFEKAVPSANDRIRVEKEGFNRLFLEAVHDIHALGMYEEFHRTGWTGKLARQTRRQLVPQIIKMVVLAWYLAATKTKTKVTSES